MRIIFIKWCSVLLTLSAIYSPNVSATSDAECGIWLCLPTGFTTGCSESHSAFWDRIKSFKSPLPSFSSCLSGGGNTGDKFTAQNGVAAHIASHQICTKQKWFHGSYGSEKRCVRWETIPEKIEKGAVCRIDKERRTRSPAHCTKTLRYTEVYRNGQLFGQTHYY